MNKYFLLFCALLCSLFANANGEFSKIELMYLALLTSEDSANNKLGARAVYGSSNVNPRIYDLIAERLIVDSQSAMISDDNYAWLLKTLGESQSLRYESVIKSSTKQNKSRKVKKFRKYSLKNLNLTALSDYKSGDFSLDEATELVTLELSKNTNLAPLTIEDLLNLAPFSLAENVLIKHGLPNSLGSESLNSSVRVTGFVSFKIAASQVGAIYENGAQLMIGKNSKGIWIVVNTLPPMQHLIVNLPQENPLHRTISLAWTWDYDSIWEAAQIAREGKPKNIEILDALAARLWWARNESDIYVVSGLAQILAALRDTDGARYLALMREIEETTAYDARLRNYATKYLKTIENTEGVEQFNAQIYFKKAIEAYNEKSSKQ